MLHLHRRGHMSSLSCHIFFPRQLRCHLFQEAVPDHPYPIPWLPRSIPCEVSAASPDHIALSSPLLQSLASGLPEDSLRLDHLVSMVAQPRAWCLAGAQNPGGGAHTLPESSAERTLGSALPCRNPCAVALRKAHMRGVPSTGLEIESWHLPSTWIPCQAACICGFIYMPNTSP